MEVKIHSIVKARIKGIDEYDLVFDDNHQLVIPISAPLDSLSYDDVLPYIDALRSHKDNVYNEFDKQYYSVDTILTEPNYKYVILLKPISEICNAECDNNDFMLNIELKEKLRKEIDSYQALTTISKELRALLSVPLESPEARFCVSTEGNFDIDVETDSETIYKVATNNKNLLEFAMKNYFGFEKVVCIPQDKVNSTYIRIKM